MTEAVLAALQQWVLFAGATLAVGCVAWRIYISPRAARALSPEGMSGLAMVESRVARIALFSTAFLLVAWAVRMVVQVMGFRDPFVPLWDDVSFLLFETFWGTVWIAQGVVALLLAVTFKRAGASPRLWWVACALSLCLIATLSLSSHAMGVERARPLIVTADGLHALAAGSWIGSLAVILAAGRGNTSSESDVAVFAAQIRSFSPMALVSGAVLLTMGLVLAWTHVQSFANLGGTTYGRLLSIKAGVAALVLGAGFWNFRRGVPAVDHPQGAAEVRGRAAGEVFLAVGVLLLTAVLVHSPKPE